MTEEVRKQKAEALHKEVSGQQFFFKQSSSQKLVTHASYIVAYNIAKSNKAFITAALAGGSGLEGQTQNYKEYNLIYYYYII